ncbi:ArgS-related anticodon-binding protein NrtL [Streptomyces sp. NPDC006134]|uniref:ArgS-related anticodon-binding protein NrtL n=1 Tax=Streptomyces sp. NPDC006134 TaxID=3154467 RepID=UPI0033F5E3DB
MTPVELSRTVLHAVRRAVDDGELSVTVPARAVITPPGPGGCGDYATNIALQLARPAGYPPRRVAEILRPRLADADGIGDVAITGPGFLNISLRSGAPAALVEEILRRGVRYGYADGSGGDGDAPNAASGQGQGAASGQDAVDGQDSAGGQRGGAVPGAPVRLRCPREVRALVVMDAVARIMRSQGLSVRTGCEARPEDAWIAVLGLRVDAYGGGAEAPSGRPARAFTVRPAPAPADPLPLGRDAARWALLHPAAHDRPRITGEHLVQREGNPLFRVRYAHARTRALLRNAADLGFGPRAGDVAGAAGSRELLAALADHPRVLGAAARHRAPDRLARHLVAVADAVLPYLPAVLPRGEEKPSAAHRARLALAEAAGTVLAGGLSLLGIDAPDHL